MTILWLLGSLYSFDPAKLKLVHGRLDTRNRARVRCSVGNLACVRWNIGNSTIFKETVTFWHLLKEIYHLFICHGIIPDICFTIYFTSKKCQRKCNYHYSLFEGLSHTYTQSLFYRLYFKVVHCNLLLLSCQPVCQWRLLQVGRSTARWLAHAQYSQYSKSDLKVY